MIARNISYFIVISVFIFSCKTENTRSIGSIEYIESINNWHATRISNLKKDNGWLNLVGLFWLSEGTNSFGSDNSNDIIFSGKAPRNIGIITLSDSIVTITVNPQAGILIDSQKVKQANLLPDVTGHPTMMDFGSLRWFIIKRGDRYGIRLRDLDAPLVKNFEGIDRFPVNVDWKIDAKFEPYEPPKKISIPTILGTVEEDTAPGRLTFEINGKQYSLDPTSAGDRFFIIFADETSGIETYGAGRFLYADAPDSNNTVLLDFNKAYNPPCAFTKYATCPLPPKQNYLKLKITAGEKNYGNH